MGLLLLQGSAALNPRELFASGEQGLWLDPSDMTAGKAGWRRNLLLNTEALSLSPWTADGATFSANTTVAPDGTTTAGTFTGASGNYRIYQQRTSVVGASHTISLYVKQGTSPTVQIDYINVNNGPVFTFATESFSTVGGFTTNVQNVGSGWYRLSITATNINSNPGPGFRASGATTFFIWGVQYEQSSTPTEYQPITDFSTEFKQAFPLHTLYQDSNGVTPCTAAGDPVGLILDQSRGGLSQIGADLVTNGTFAADSDWTKGANWTIGSGVATKTGGAANNLTQTIGSTAAAWYRISLDVTRTAGTLTVSLGTSGTTYAITATGSYTFFILAGSGTQTLTLEGDSSFAGTVDNVVVRNVPGNHAYQTTSASRPTLQTTGGLWYLSFDGSDDSLVTNSVDFATWTQETRRNLLVDTESLSTSNWVSNGGTVTENTTVAPDGTTTADTLTRSTAPTEGRYQSVAFTGDGAKAVSVYVKAGTAPSLGVWLFDSTATVNRILATVDMTGATPIVTLTAGASSAVENVGNGWFRLTFVSTSVTAANTNRLYLMPAYGIASANGQTSIFWGVQAENATASTTYQRVGTDEMTVIAGVRKLSDAASAMFLESSVNVDVNNGSFAITAPGSAGAEKWKYISRGTSTVDALTTSAAYNAPNTVVLSATSDISGDSCVLRLSGTQIDSDTGDQGSGNFGNYQLFIGRRNQATLPFNGHLYQLIIRGKTTPTGKLLEAERFVGRKTGIFTI